MKFHSSSAKHKLSIVALLLILFALPFVIQWHAVTTFDSKALMAGGAVIGNSAFTDQSAQAPTTNNASQAISTAGNDFVGAMAN